MADTTASNSKHNEILKMFDRRARSSKLTLLVLIYTLVLIVLLVFIGVFYTKNNDNTPIGKLVSAAIESKNVNYSELSSIANSLQDSYQKQYLPRPKVVTPEESDEKSAIPFFPGEKDKEVSLPTAIASVLLSLSLMIFIGFVMKGILIFIRYYMQLVADYENQKIAYILSEGETIKFSDYLSTLRTNNIHFEKSPTMPQEKIILSLIDAVKKGKSKTEETTK